VNENEELPQPPKSPYASALERDEQNQHGEVRSNANTAGSSIQYTDTSKLQVFSRNIVM